MTLIHQLWGPPAGTTAPQATSIHLHSGYTQPQHPFPHQEACYFPEGTGEKLKENKLESTGNAKTKGNVPGHCSERLEKG